MTSAAHGSLSRCPQCAQPLDGTVRVAAPSAYLVRYAVTRAIRPSASKALPSAAHSPHSLFVDLSCNPLIAAIGASAETDAAVDALIALCERCTVSIRLASRSTAGCARVALCVCFGESPTEPNVGLRGF